ncbi:MAG: hypothetical protein ACHQAW_01660 [Actinomycetota bacterium]
MKLRRAAIALSTLAMIAIGPGPVGPAPAAAGVRPQVTTLLALQTRPIKVHGYHLAIAVEQVAVDGKVQFTFLTIALERREPTSGSETLEQIHQWGWQLPKTAFHLHRDLSQGWIDTGDRMGPLGHLHMRFDATGGHPFTGACGSQASRPGPLRGNIGTAFLLRADSSFFGTLKGQRFAATVIGVTQCGGGGGGGTFCPSSGLGATVSDESGFRSMPAPTRLTRRALGTATSVQPGGLLHPMLASATAHQFVLAIRTRRFNLFELATGGGHEAHAMALLTQRSIVAGGVTADTTDLQIVPPADTASWLSGSESITGPGDPTAHVDRCRGRTFRTRMDNNVTSVAGGGGALTAHFDSVGDVAIDDGLLGSAQQTRRVP